ncbi:MAG: hypothetical protein ACRYF3_01360 [Janthinobacterium lividum]
MPKADRLDGSDGAEHSGQMRSAGGWGINLAMPQALMLALHLRDAAGLTPPSSPIVPAFPPLDPPAHRLRTAGADLAGLEAAGQQWVRWWSAAFPGGPAALTSILPPRFPGLAGMTELRGLAELGMDDAVSWCTRAREVEAGLLRSVPSALFETNLVTDVERQLGRAIRPFTLQVVVLPVRGSHSWDLPGGAVISLGLRADRDAYLEWLRTKLVAIGQWRATSADPAEHTDRPAPPV